MQFCAISVRKIYFNVKELKNHSNIPGSEGVSPSCVEGKMPSLPGSFIIRDGLKGHDSCLGSKSGLFNRTGRHF